MAFCIKNLMPLVTCSSVDSGHMLRAAELADKSAGYTAPHPNAGCVIARGSKVVAEGFLYGQGTRAAEIKAVEQAKELAKGSTAYLNLEPGDCHGDDSSVNALIQAGVSKVVVGLKHPLKHFRGKAIKALRDARIEVNVLGEDLQNRNIQVAETRFASHTIVLRRLVKVKEALKHMVISAQWGIWKNSNTARAINVRRMILDEDWWGLVNYVLEITDPIMAMLRFADSDQPCLGDIYDSMDSMLEKIKMAIQRRENDPEDTLYKKVEKIVHHRWNKMTTPLHLLAYALSPRYYSVELLDLPGRVPPFRDAEVADGYKKALAKIFQDPEIGAIVRSEFAAFNSGEDFLPIAIAGQSRMSAIKWWYLHGQAFMYLQPLAIKVLSQEALRACQFVNAPLLYREACRIPFSVLKYAMTLDGKIAASTGHAAWVSSKTSRKRVFEARSRSDAIVVGGNTVRRDNPRLTTRQEGGHLPARIVMSRSLKLPEDANLWDVSAGHTIVVTQHGANRTFQQRLARKGVEVVEFDMLTPKAVMEYCYDRGFLYVLWECGGSLSAPAIESAVIHKVIAFIAPKIIGGVTAPGPVGDLGMVEMTQALNLSDVSFEQIGPDMLISGYLHPIPDLMPIIPAMEASAPELMLSASDGPNIISFYKAWNAYGAFSNFSPHPIKMINKCGDYVTWKSVEHYYQAQKFEGVQDFLVQECIERIKSAESPEEAARIGRTLERQRPELVRDKWESVKIDVMYRALKCKFSMYPHLSSLLVSTAGSILVEASPHDLFWGGGQEGEGLNHLGRLLMRIRAELLEDDSGISRINLSTRSSIV